jgi:enoyl-CoA hydratase/carnithine racemase
MTEEKYHSEYDMHDGLGTIRLTCGGVAPEWRIANCELRIPECGRMAEFLNGPELLAVVVEGEEDAFGVGGDEHAVADLAELLATATVPVAAVIRGDCRGGGLALARACHFRFAAADARLSFPDELGGVVRGDDAAAAGLVDRAAPADEIREQATAFLRSLTTGRLPAQIRAVMASIQNATRLPEERALLEEKRLFRDLAVALMERNAKKAPE